MACSLPLRQREGRQDDPSSHAAHTAHAANGDLREVTASAEELPAFLDEQPETVRPAYRIAGALDDTCSGCGVCVQIAVVTAQTKQQGKSDLDIRQYVDSYYQTGYAKPTDTPMPAA
ncbi:PCYCGC motif-containing (lipo)protein [Cohnella hongkongensis]|uniref:PCYCGC motif-containing (Lipo)protein n=1 Tax=Cohnella hongkongensis TaxID=178337 RepID=A0ABV9FHC4_9BACL